MKLKSSLGNISSKDSYYKPGDTVPDSGIYDLYLFVGKFNGEQPDPHPQVTCIKGRKFPPCRKCVNKCAHVKYKTKFKAIHAEKHYCLRREES